MKADPAVENYLMAAQSWEMDRANAAERSRKTAWVVAGVAIAVAFIEAIAVAGLTPLKTVTPFVIRVDNSSGVVDVVPEYRGTTEVQPLITRTLLTQYVTARERFFHGTAEVDFELVAAQNTAVLNQEWAALWDKAKPSSPLNLFKDGTTVRVQIRSISFLKLGSGREVAQVRFSKFVRPGGTGDEQLTHWLSTIETAYTSASKDEKTRSLNPLGFKVVEYRREPEVVAASDKGAL